MILEPVEAIHEGLHPGARLARHPRDDRLGGGGEVDDPERVIEVPGTAASDLGEPAIRDPLGDGDLSLTQMRLDEPEGEGEVAIRRGLDVGMARSFQRMVTVASSGRPESGRRLSRCVRLRPREKNHLRTPG